jgi:hypothetical protein
VKSSSIGILSMKHLLYQRTLMVHLRSGKSFPIRTISPSPFKESVIGSFWNQIFFARNEPGFSKKNYLTSGTSYKLLKVRGVLWLILEYLIFAIAALGDDPELEPSWTAISQSNQEWFALEYLPIVQDIYGEAKQVHIQDPTKMSAGDCWACLEHWYKIGHLQMLAWKPRMLPDSLSPLPLEECWWHSAFPGKQSWIRSGWQKQLGTQAPESWESQELIARTLASESWESQECIPELKSSQSQESWDLVLDNFLALQSWESQNSVPGTLASQSRESQNLVPGTLASQSWEPWVLGLGSQGVLWLQKQNIPAYGTFINPDYITPNPHASWNDLVSDPLDILDSLAQPISPSILTALDLTPDRVLKTAEACMQWVLSALKSIPGSEMLQKASWALVAIPVCATSKGSC